MSSSQWVGLAVALLLIGGLLYAFVRHGTKTKSDADRKHDPGTNLDNHGGHGDSGGH
jgi:hypothetical protein